MTDSRINLLQAAVCLIALVAGGILYWCGARNLAQWTWLGGSCPVVLSILIDIWDAIRHRKFGLDLIALIAIAGAVALQEFLTAVVIALMFTSGRALERYAENRARKEMSALLGKAPQMANRYEDSGIVQVPLAAVQLGDRILVRAGETVPVDGTLINAAVVDESSLTGEALPVSYSEGESLQSGVINAGDAFDMLATSNAADSTFSNIIRLVQTAQNSKAPAARLADKYALLFVPVTLCLAGLAWLFTGDPTRALAVVVVATPCPLILAVPVAIVCAMSRCAERGVLVKHGGALEKMGQVRTLFFDKTGTLTGGKAKLSAIAADPRVQKEEALYLAASLEQMSGHAIAQAVVSAALERGLSLSTPEGVTEQPGAGLSGWVDGKSVRVGSYEYVLGGGVEKPDWSITLVKQIGYEGASGVYIAVDDQFCAVLLMADEIRQETPRAMRLLRASGVKRIAMLTGDSSEVAKAVSEGLNMDDVLAEQTPASKLAVIADARAGGVTMMVGDGVNDAPALAAADIGVAMGARGAAAAAESAQIVLLVDRVDRLAFAVRIAKKTRTIALQSVWVGMGLSLLAMLVAALGYLPPIAGAVLQEVIDVVVILNALRVLTLEKDRAGSKMSAGEVERQKEEHARLLSIVDGVGRLADRADNMSMPEIRRELTVLNASLHDQLLPHESSDEARLYPQVARLIGGEDPMASMSATHREIYRLCRRVDWLVDGLADGGNSCPSKEELRRTLYALDAILRLHFSQEEEIYHSVSS